MSKPKLSKSIRKYIRTQKAIIRRSFGSSSETEKKIKELMEKFKVND